MYDSKVLLTGEGLEVFKNFKFKNELLSGPSECAWGLPSPPTTIRNPQETEGLLFRNDILAVQSSLPFFFSYWLWHSWLVLFSLVRICSPTFICPLPRSHEHLQRPFLQRLSPRAETGGLGDQVQSFSCEVAALPLEPLALTPVFLSYWFLTLSIPYPFSVSTCTVRMKQVSPLCFLTCRIRTMTAPSLGCYCVSW